MNPRDYSDADIGAMAKSIRDAKAVNKAIADNIRNVQAKAKQAYLDLGMSDADAESASNNLVQQELYDMQTKLGGWR